MDVSVAEERNRDALVRVLAALFAMIGLVRGGMVASVPRALRLKVLRLLRPTESSVRRLLIVAAQKLDISLPETWTAPAAKPKTKRRGKRGSAPGFPLIEPLQRTSRPAPRYVPGPGPRIFFFDGRDVPPESPAPEPTPDDAVDARRLCRRLFVLRSVLENMPKYARRLAIWQAKREAGRRRGRVHPIRPGRPPGHRARGRHPVDEILIVCDDLARYAMSPHDTS